MDIKLFSLCKQEVPESEKGKDCILRCIDSLFPGCEGFSAFTSQKRMLLAISQSLRAADIVVVAVQSNMYNATKRLLSAALGIKLEKNDTAAEKLEKMRSARKINQAAYDANILFPSGAEIMISDNGLNSGFILSSGGQHIIYLPIEAPKCEDIVYSSLYDFLIDLCDTEAVAHAVERRHTEIIERTVEKLNSDSVKTAIHSEVMQKFIVSRIDKEKYNTEIIFDDDFDERTDQELESFYIKTARELRDKHHAQYGVVFSKPYEDESTYETFIIVAIADEKGTNTFKIFADSGELAKDLFSAAVDKTMLMLYDYSGMTGSEDDDKTTEDDKRLRKSAAMLTAAAVGATTIIGLITALILK